MKENQSNMKVKIHLGETHPTCERGVAKALQPAGEYDPRTIEVLGVPFGGHIEGRDSYGEAFTEDTAIGMRFGNTVPVTYYHGFTDDGGYQDPVVLIGEATYTRRDERGHWFDVQIDTGEPYSQRIFDALDNGDDVKASSGAVAHLVRYGEAGLITSWVVGEIAVFDTNEIRQPANQLAVVGYKAESEIPQSEAREGGEPKAQSDAGDGEADIEVKTTIKDKEIKMSEQVENQEPTNAVDYEKIAALVDAAVTKAANAPAKNAGQPAVETEKPKDTYKAAFHGYLHRKTVKALQEGTDSEGGYLTPTEESAEFVAGLKDKSIIRMAGARVIPMNSDSMTVPTLTHATAAVLTAEEGAYSDVDPSFGQVTFTAYKPTHLNKVSEELVADSNYPLWEALLRPDFEQAFAAYENSYFTTGTGSGQPQGVVTGAGTGVTAASATAITASEIVSLYHSLGYLYRNNAVWMMNDSTIEAVRKLVDSNGVFIWQPGLAAGQPDMILGRPVITNNAMAEIATGNKTILFGDMSYYWIGERAGLSITRADELYLATGQVGFFGRKRNDAHVMLAEAFKVLVQA